MAKWLVWYTLEGGFGDAVEVEAENRGDAEDAAFDVQPKIDTIDKVELIG